MSIFDDQPDIDPLSPEATGAADLLRRAARIRSRWSHAMDLLADAERDEQRQAEEAAEAHMDSPWPHRPAS